LVYKVFIDGQAGTTGLRLAERLSERPDIELIGIEEARRKDVGARLSCIAAADVTFLCLPDDGAREIIAAVDAAIDAAANATGNDEADAAANAMADGEACVAEKGKMPNAAEKSTTCVMGNGTACAEDEGRMGARLAKARIIDCSTAHRTAPGWIYGMPELYRGNGYAVAEDGLAGAECGYALVWEEYTRAGKGLRVSNPGCHATGFILSVRPLVEAGIVDPGAMLAVHSLTGYSGGGKPMIAEYADKDLRAPRRYALGQGHKHIPEMQQYAGLETAPLFSPIVCDFYSGMLVGVPLPRGALRRDASAGDIRNTLAEYYRGSPVVKVRALGEEFSEAAGGGFLSADAFAGRDDLEIFVTGEDGRIEIISRYDNLGKGASGAAVQNMNLMLGLPEDTGLITGE